MGIQNSDRIFPQPKHFLDVYAPQISYPGQSLLFHSQVSLRNVLGRQEHLAKSHWIKCLLPGTFLILVFDRNSKEALGE